MNTVVPTGLKDLDEGDIQLIKRNLQVILRMSHEMAQDGHARAHEIYVAARDSLDAMVFDQVSRDVMKRLQGGGHTFQGYDISPTVVSYLRNGQMINAIKELRTDHGMGLKEAKDLAEALRDDLNRPRWQNFG
jgi:hypothetical protein